MIKELEKLAYSIPNFAKAVDISVSAVREAIDKGDLVPSYPNSKPLILLEEGKRWLDSLPTEKPERAAS